MAVTVTKRSNSSGILSPNEFTASQTVGRVGGPVMFVWDHRTNQFCVLNQGFLAEACVLAEQYGVLGRVFESAELTIDAGSEVGTEVTASIEVPAGELWFINGATVTPTFAEGETGTCSFNLTISPAGGTEWNYYASNQSLTVGTDIDIRSDLFVPLRLVAGSKVTLKVTVTADFTDEATVEIALSGTKNRRLV